MFIPSSSLIHPPKEPYSTIMIAGVWYYLAKENLPSLTLVGSSNYGRWQCVITESEWYLVVGHRSLTRDLEVQLAVVTENAGLRYAFHKVIYVCD